MNPKSQTSSFTVVMVTPIRKDANVHHLEERLRKCVKDEFRSELATSIANNRYGTKVLVTSRDGGSHEPMNTADYAALTTLSPDNARALLYATFNEVPLMVAEYIKEAEHQDGESYWDFFTTAFDLFEDFKGYCREASKIKEEE